MLNFCAWRQRDRIYAAAGDSQAVRSAGVESQQLAPTQSRWEGIEDHLAKRMVIVIAAKPEQLQDIFR